MTNSTENNFKISKESIAVIDFGEYMAGDVSAFNKVVA
jgi:hypothetical protein